MGKHDITRLIHRGVDSEEIEDYVDHMDEHEHAELVLRLQERAARKKAAKKKKAEFDRHKREISEERAHEQTDNT